MSRKVKVTVKNHVFYATAILRNEENTLMEIDLGNLSTNKKMTESGMKKEFEKILDLPPSYSLVAIDVRKLDDETYTYTMNQDEFIEKANLEVSEEKVEE